MNDNRHRQYVIRLLTVFDQAHQIHCLMSRRTQHITGMTLELSAVLCWIDRENGESTIYQLAANLSRTSNTITRVVDVLERRGLVERHRAQTGDRRLVYVTMTLEGESTLGSFREATFVIIEPILASIGEYELRRSLDQVIDTLSVISGH
mgnify:FL=1